MNLIFRTVFLFICLALFVGCGPDRDDIRGWYKDYKNGKISKSQAIELISDTLKSKNYRTRKTAAVYLADLGDHRAYKPLLEIMKNSGECSDRRTAIRALGTLGDQRAIEHLLPLLEERVVVVSGNTRRDCDFGSEAMVALGDIGDPRAVEPLIKELTSTRYSRDQDAIVALGKIADPRAIDPLIEVLKQQRYESKDAAWALGEIKNARAIDPLIEYLISVTLTLNQQKTQFNQNKKIKFFRYQEEATKALLKLGNQVIDPLINSILMTQGYGYINMDFVRILLEFGDLAIDNLIVKLKHGDPHICSKAAGMLGAIKHPRAVNPLIEALNNEDEKVQGAVMRALGRIGAPAVDPLIEALNDEDKEFRAAVIAALGRIGTPAAVDTLISVAENRSSDLRLNAVQAMCMISNPKAEKYIYDEVLKKGDLKIVAGIYGFLIRKGKEDFIPALVKALHQYGDKDMAFCFLNSGNANLYVAASKWATKHGYGVTTIQTIGGGSQGWGSER